jgi:hypothetical protein
MQKVKAHIEDRDSRKLFFWTLMGVLIALACMYFYLINRTVWNIIDHQRAQASINTINTQIGSLQSESLALQSAITPDVAHSLGFEEIADAHYVSLAAATTPVASDLAGILAQR